MDESNPARAFSHTEIEALTILYLQNQHLAGIEITRLVDLYFNTKHIIEIYLEGSDE